jgi:hypothetical protein
MLRQGDRIVIMSYETRFLVTSVLWLQDNLRTKIGWDLNLRWLADLRNLAFFIGSFLIGIFALFGYGWLVRLVGGGEMKQIKKVVYN